MRQRHPDITNTVTICQHTPQKWPFKSKLCVSCAVPQMFVDHRQRFFQQSKKTALNQLRHLRHRMQQQVWMTKFNKLRTCLVTSRYAFKTTAPTVEIDMFCFQVFRDAVYRFVSMQACRHGLCLQPLVWPHLDIHTMLPLSLPQHSIISPTKPTNLPCAPPSPAGPTRTEGGARVGSGGVGGGYTPPEWGKLLEE